MGEKHEKLYLQVYNGIRDYIIKNHLQPGDVLPSEMEMMGMFGVSRNVLREATKALELMNVISSKNGVGKIINHFDIGFISSCMFLNLLGDESSLVVQSMDVRRVLEIGFSRIVFDSLSNENLSKLKKITEEMKIDRPFSDFYELDEAFHKILLSDAGNSVLSAFVDATWACNKYIKDKFIDENLDVRYKKHIQIVEALEARDYNAYCKALEFHFTESYMHLKEKE